MCLMYLCNIKLKIKNSKTKTKVSSPVETFMVYDHAENVTFVYNNFMLLNTLWLCHPFSLLTLIRKPQLMIHRIDVYKKRDVKSKNL